MPQRYANKDHSYSFWKTFNELIFVNLFKIKIIQNKNGKLSKTNNKKSFPKRNTYLQIGSFLSVSLLIKKYNYICIRMDRFTKYLKIALPTLFIAYLGCLIAFTHVHIINGVTIVHSHPYHKNDNGTSGNEHTYAEFQLLHQLSTVQISGAAFISVLITTAEGSVFQILCPPVCMAYLCAVPGKLSLRAPPVA